MNHTPKPWYLKIEAGDGKGQYTDKCRTFTIESASRANMFTAQAWQFADDPKIFEEVEANARLATAAPELLKACQVALRFIELAQEDEPENLAERVLRAAINKALGQK